MKVTNVKVEGDFQSLALVGDPYHRVLGGTIVVSFDVVPGDGEQWRRCWFKIPVGRKWDGASRPEIVGWLVPRFGIFSLASLVHDFCFDTRPLLWGNFRITRKMTDQLFWELMRQAAKKRTGNFVARWVEIGIASVMSVTVRLLGESTWDKHDRQFR